MVVAVVAQIVGVAGYGDAAKMIARELGGDLTGDGADLLCAVVIHFMAAAAVEME